MDAADPTTGNGRAPARKRPRPSPRRLRLRALERAAARRTLNGNGSDATVPPLPATNDADDAADDDAGGGLGALTGHPYGALPYGNLHVAAPPAGAHPDGVRRRGLGPGLRALNDEQVLAVLGYVDGPSLAGGVVAASRFLYVAGHHGDLWRDLVLRRWGGGGFAVPEPEPGRDRGAPACWRDVYAANHRPGAAPVARARPRRVAGIYSDTLFRSHLCHAFALRPSWLAAHTVPTLPHAQVTAQLFLTEYEENNRPLLVTGAAADWPALRGPRRWTPAYLRRAAAGATFRATSGAAPLSAAFALDDYLRYCASAAEEAPLYLFDRTFAEQCPQLLEDFEPALRKGCPWWSPGEKGAGHDLFGALGEAARPDHQWLIVGPKRSGSCFHIDPNCTHAWNAPILGRKRWIFYPPGATPPGVFPSASGDDVCMPISIGEWFLTFWDAHVARRTDPDPGRRPLECTARPGDVLFVPHGWWHMVLNLGDEDAGGGCGGEDRGVSVALTRNYVSASNLSDVLRFLDTRVTQISGCRDRAEAVPPEALGRELRRALLAVPEDAGDDDDDRGEEKKCDDGRGGPDRRKWAALLHKAEARAKEGWGCAAWVDAPPPAAGREAGSCDGGEKKTSGSSILARAKQAPRIGTSAAAIDDIAPPESSSGGFSFSFL